MSAAKNYARHSSRSGADLSYLNITPVRTAKFLFGIIAFLQLMNLLSLFFEKVLSWDNFISHGMEYYFDVSREGNIPELFSALTLFISGILLILISFNAKWHIKRSHKKYWLILGLLFLFLTIDESTQIHEQFNKIKTAIGPLNGYLLYSWILIYAALTILIGCLFLKFLFQLPVRTRILFIISASMYAGAALAFEIPEGRSVSENGFGNTQDKLLCTIEETLEMSGIALFIYSLLDYIATNGTRLMVTVTSQAKTIAISSPVIVVPSAESGDRRSRHA